MTQYATMRQLQREGSHIITSLPLGDELILTKRGQTIARIIPEKPRKKADWNTMKKFAGAYTGVHPDPFLRELDNDWE